MRERPIIFSGPMVTSILRSEKTQTRRIVKPQPVVEPDGRMHWNGIGWTRHHERLTGPNGTMLMKCPFGQTGDRMYVKEAWRTGSGLDDHSPRQIAEQSLDAGWEEPWAPLRYEADGRERDALWHDFGDPGRLRSPIHLPRWASRLTLEVTGVRVERLQDISEGDAIAEGWEGGAAGNPGNGGPFDWFRGTWDSINAKRGHGWDTNPFVWVVTFKQVTP